MGMPPLTLHVVVAKQIADRLGHRLLDGERGSLYLGSTSPDIRVLTRCDRRLTHFFDLSCFEEQSGVQGLFEAHPHLAEVGKLNPAMVAFVAGYISHLVMDETWINDVYRPFFGERSPLGGNLRANIMDRVMQYELDREKRSDRRMMAHVLEELARKELAIDIGFIDGATMRRWHEVTLEVVNHPPDWQRFPYIAGRHLREAGIDTPEAFAQFLKTLPDLVEETTNYLTRERIQAFLEDSLARGLEAIRGYLGCD